MNGRYKLIVFDWDGTLYDSAAFIVSCMQKTILHLELVCPSIETLRYVIGLSLEAAVMHLFPDLDEAQQEQYATYFRQLIREDDGHEPKLFPQTTEVLMHLKEQGYWLAIATGKSREGLDHDLSYFKLHDYFVATRSATETRSKPHPDMLLDILKETGVNANEVLMIGDTIFDMQLAANAKVDALGVSCGVHDVTQLAPLSTQGVLPDVSHLPNWLSLQTESRG